MFRSSSTARHGEDDGLDQRHVLVDDRLHGQPADAGIGEHRLRDHRAAQEVPQLEPDRGHDRDRPVAEGVPQDHRPLAHALRPRRPEEVLVQDLEHARPRDARGPGHGPDAEGHGGQDDGERALGAVDRHPAEVHGEDEDQEDAEPERGHALARERERHRSGVQEGAPPHRGQDAERQRDEDRQHDGGDRERGRRREALEDQRQRGLAVPEGAPEVALDGPRQEVPVLLRQRPVEPEGGAHDLVVRLRALRPHVERRGIAREMDDEEDGEGDADQDRDRPGESLTEVRDHARAVERERGPRTMPSRLPGRPSVGALVTSVGPPPRTGGRRGRPAPILVARLLQCQAPADAGRHRVEPAMPSGDASFLTDAAGLPTRSPSRRAGGRRPASARAPGARSARGSFRARRS